MENNNIVGKGAMAKMLQKADNVDKLFFVSGVSNSSCVDEDEYRRERELLLAQDRDRHIVYISSLAVLEPESKHTRYIKHKRQMEVLIKKNFEKYTIVRIGNIGWENDNPHTIINFLRNKIKNNEPFEVQDVYRYVVDEDEFLYWVNMIPEWSAEMNIPGRRMKVKDIVEKYVNN